MTGLVNFAKAESTFSQTVDIPSGSVQPIIVELFTDESFKLPFHIRTGPQGLGDVSDRKNFSHVEFHGYGSTPGTLRVRVYIDGRYVCDGNVTLSENPNTHRRINIPIGRKIGHTIDLEICGNANLRSIEYTFEGTDSPS